MTVPKQAWPSHVISATVVQINDPGTYVIATSAGNAVVTMPVRSPDPSTTDRRKMHPNTYKIVALPTAKPVTIQRASGDQFLFNGGVSAVNSFVLLPGETVEILDDGLYWIPVAAIPSPAVYRRVYADSGAALTLGRHASLWVFTGAAATTWTLPPLADNPGLEYVIKNRGSTDITLQRAGSDNLYTTTSVTSITIAPGATATVISDGTGFWNVC